MNLFFFGCKTFHKLWQLLNYVKENLNMAPKLQPTGAAKSWRTLLSDLSCTPPGRSACWAGFCTCHRLPRWCIWKQHDIATKTTEAHLICHWNVEISMNFWGGNGPLPFCLVCLLYMVQVSIKAQPPPEQTVHPNHQPVIRLPIRFFCYIYNKKIYIYRTIKCKWWILH